MHTTGTGRIGGGARVHPIGYPEGSARYGCLAHAPKLLGCQQCHQVVVDRDQGVNHRLQRFELSARIVHRESLGAIHPLLRLRDVPGGEPDRVHRLSFTSCSGQSSSILRLSISSDGYTPARAAKAATTCPSRRASCSTVSADSTQSPSPASFSRSAAALISTSSTLPPSFRQAKR